MGKVKSSSGNRVTRDMIKNFLEQGQIFNYWSRGFDFPRRCKQIFEGVDFTDKKMLEIGCGKGLFCMWASMLGAQQVVGLEPLEEGSFDSSEIYSEFQQMVDKLKLENIDILPERVEDYDNKGSEFDIVLSIASINHLDEDHCIDLHDNEESMNIYKAIFRNIACKTKNGGKLIILDCSNRNIFADIGVTNPMEKRIEWFKHHSPEFWAELLSECGFSQPKISWLSGRFLRYLRIYKRNKILSYFIDSAFKLEMTCIK